GAVITAQGIFDHKILIQISLVAISFILYLYYMLDKKIQDSCFFDVFSISPFLRHFAKINLIFMFYGILSLVLILVKPNFCPDTSNLVSFVTSYMFTCTIYQPQNNIKKGIILLSGNLMIVIMSGFGIIFTFLILTILFMFLLKLFVNESSF